MKRYRAAICLLFSGAAASFLALPVFANSSWVWISETRPFDLLPAVIAGTLLIETTAVLFSLQRRRFWKVLFFVTLGNLLSFAAPYLYILLVSAVEGIYSFSRFIDHWPSYTVGVIFLIVTIAIELPVVWFALRKDARDQRRFAWTVIAVNVLTTGLTALAERLLCRGNW